MLLKNKNISLLFSDFFILESKILIFGMSQTFFKRVQHKFTDVSLDDGVELLPFLDACRDYLEFYDLFGGTVFAPIKSDVNGNVGKLQGASELMSQIFSIV